MTYILWYDISICLRFTLCVCVYVFADLAPAILDWCRSTVSSMKDLLCSCCSFVFAIGWRISVAIEDPAITYSISTAMLSPWCWSTASRARAHGQIRWTGSPSMASSSSPSSWPSAHGPVILSLQTRYFQALTRSHQVITTYVKWAMIIFNISYWSLCSIAMSLMIVYFLYYKTKYSSIAAYIIILLGVKKSALSQCMKYSLHAVPCCQISVYKLPKSKVLHPLCDLVAYPLKQLIHWQYLQVCK